MTRYLGRVAALVAVLFSVLVPAAAQAFNYVQDANGVFWGVQDVAAPRVDTGSIRATQATQFNRAQLTTGIQGYGGIRVSVDEKPAPRFNGALMRGFGLGFDGDDSFVSTQAVNLGGVHITRAVTIEKTSDYGRWLDTFLNTTNRVLTVHVAFGGQTGTGSSGPNSTTIIGTQSGDTTVGANDGWVDVAPAAPTSATSSTIGDVVTVLGDADFGGTGDFLHDTFTEPLMTTGHEANFQGYITTLVLAPGQAESVLHYVIAGPPVTSATVASTRATLTAQATTLAATPDLSGLTPAQICSIQNFSKSSLGIATTGFGFGRLGFGSGGINCFTAGRVSMPAAPAPQVAVTNVPYNVVGKSINQLQAAMEAHQVTSVEITKAYLDRIEAYDQGPFGFNSFEYVAQDALAQARKADIERAHGRRGLLLGIPFGVKMLYDTEDMPTTNGSLVLAGFRPHDDATQVARLRAAGAVIIGKTAMEEYATSGDYSNDPWGQVWNAFDPSKSSIASSGGSAVATALSFDAAALGSQTGDSLYGPSSAASLVTLRGTDGLESGAGIMPLTYLTDFGGVIAQTVPDLADVLDTVAGPDPADPMTQYGVGHIPADWRTMLKPDALKGKVIGLIPSTWVDPFGTTDTVDAEMAAAKKYLTEAGATVVTAGTTVGGVSNSPTRTAVAPTLPAGTSITTAGWDDYIDEHPELQTEGFPIKDYQDIECSQLKLPYTRLDPTSSTCSPSNTATVPEADVTAYRQYRVALQTDLANWMDQVGPGGTPVDAVVYPGLLSDISLNDGGGSQASFGRSDTPSANFGSPTIIFPAGKDSEGQPVNIQLLGRAWSDPQLVGYAYAFELKAQADGDGRQLPTTAPPLPYVRNAKVPYPKEPATPIVGADPAVVNPTTTKHHPLGPKKR
jgi:amidase